jgi:hypothetical protein
MPRMLLAAAVAIAAAVAVPSLAQGATLHQNGSHQRILLQDAVGEANLVSVEGSRSVVIHDLNMPIKVAGVPGCKLLDAWTVRCTSARYIELDLGDGPDVATIATPRDVEVEGGNGPDRYYALASGGPSRVSFSGGIGLDVANYFYATAGVDVSVDLEAGDGRPGDDDQILRDVEEVVGSQHADVLAGSDRTVRLTGQDGDDRITGGSAAETLLGGDGNDRIDARDGAPDTVDCGGQLLDSALVDIDTVTRCAEVAS